MVLLRGKSRPEWGPPRMGLRAPSRALIRTGCGKMERCHGNQLLMLSRFQNLSPLPTLVFTARLWLHVWQEFVGPQPPRMRTSDVSQPLPQSCPSKWGRGPAWPGSPRQGPRTSCCDPEDTAGVFGCQKQSLRP